MLSQIGLIHLFCSPYFQKAGSSTTGLLFLSSRFYQGYNLLRADIQVIQNQVVFASFTKKLYCQIFKF